MKDAINYNQITIPAVKCKLKACNVIYLRAARGNCQLTP